MFGRYTGSTPEEGSHARHDEFLKPGGILGSDTLNPQADLPSAAPAHQGLLDNNPVWHFRQHDKELQDGATR